MVMILRLAMLLHLFINPGIVRVGKISCVRRRSAAGSGES
jgi:hypothetical protein